MTNRKRRRPAPSGYRDPKPAPRPEPERRRGLLDSFLAPRIPGSTNMPKLGASIARGFATVAGTPALVVGPLVFLLVQWLVLVGLGFQGPFAALASSLGLSQIGTNFDATISTSLFGLGRAFIGVFALVAIRAIVLAMLTGLVIDALDFTRPSRWTIVRGLAAVPTTLAVSIIGVALLTVTLYIGPLFGPGFNILVQLGGRVLGVYLFAFAPVIAVTERASMPEALSKSIRAARMPGAGNLSAATLYVFASIVPIAVPTIPGNLIGVNPSIGAWAFVLLVNLFHVIALATFAYRYRSVADDVPAAAPRGPAARARR